MGQLRLFSSCPRINCPAEIRHKHAPCKQEPKLEANPWNDNNTAPDSFHMATFLTFLQYSTQLW